LFAVYLHTVTVLVESPLVFCYHVYESSRQEKNNLDREIVASDGCSFATMTMVVRHDLEGWFSSPFSDRFLYETRPFL
jgi:hypothetical protein